ncbi:hypothetical protein LA635_1243 [Erwinia amylovora LA635]|nr:hypothetical protein LA635_1243 [Erwinia amylovora LA635]CDK18235.1 hypothetical protein LA636_1243 [Erwinia amylovora LA636]CDK21604.1 hypothetical protein LA637_1244 [Erwinia amylovora LA637]
MIRGFRCNRYPATLISCGEECPVFVKSEAAVMTSGKYLTKYRLLFHLPYKLLQHSSQNSMIQRTSYCSSLMAMIKPMKKTTAFSN